MSKPFVIRDPVHGYVRVAAHERIVVDHPVTQRLRRITQTGLAELVFPEARTSRFVHSLGAMHLASRFVISAIENADESVAKSFFEEVQESVKFGISLRQNDLNALLEPSATRSTGGLLAGRGVFKNSALRKNERYVCLLGLVEAALRLAALFHDLGHLPFSHDFEFALKAFVADGVRNSNNQVDPKLVELTRSEERRVGEECRSRW